MIRRWLLPVLWAACILAASSDLFSANHTGRLLQDLVAFILRHPLSPARFASLHFLIRKAAHLTEYGMFALLSFRALRNGRPGWMWQWAIGAIALAVMLASVDEWHQSFVPSRTGTSTDVAIDGCGAMIAQLVPLLRRRRSVADAAAS